MNALYGQLKDDLRRTETGSFSPLVKAEACFRLTALYFAELKLMVEEHPFSPDDEITLYKYIAPAFFEEIIYYLSIMELESQGGDRAGIRSYCRQEMEDIKSYLERQDHLRQYMSGGKAYLDEILFRQQPEAFRVFPHHLGFSGTEHFNPHSYLVAKIAAYLRLYPYLERKARDVQPDSLPEQCQLPQLPDTAPEIPLPLLEFVIADIRQKIGWLKTKTLPATGEQNHFLLQARLKYSSLLSFGNKKDD